MTQQFPAFAERTFECRDELRGSHLGFLLCAMGIFYIQIEAPLQILDLNLPRDVAFLALVPPLDERRELVELDGFGFGVALLALGQAVLPIPDFLRWSAFLEEEQVRGDGGGEERGLRKADDGVEVAVGEEFFADALLVAVASDAAIWQDDGAAATGLEKLDHEDDEEVGGFPAAEGLREVRLHAVGDAGSEGRIGEDALHLLLGADGVVFGLEAVEVMPVRHVEAVEDEIGEAEDIGDGLQLPARDGFLEDGFIVERADFLFADVINGSAEKAACAGGGVEDFFAEPGRGHLRHELGDGAGRVVFALVSRIAQLDEDGLIDSAEDMAVVAVVEVEAVELVDDLPQLVAGLHVVIRAIEDFLHEGGALRGVGSFEILERGEEAVGGMVDEEDEFLAGDTFGVSSPVPPLELLRDDGLVAVADEFEFLVFVVENFQEEEPAELLQPLGIAGDAAILPHDVPDIFDDRGDVGHRNKDEG